jgi:heme-degrading monooxygenase HmoA
VAPTTSVMPMRRLRALSIFSMTSRPVPCSQADVRQTRAHTPCGHASAGVCRGRCGMGNWRPENNEEPAVILELADIRIHPGQNAAFEEALQRGASTVIGQAKGFKGFKVNRGIESPERYVLQIFWDTLEDHTVAFRQGPLFAQWRAIVGPFFNGAPVVEHFELVTKS